MCQITTTEFLLSLSTSSKYCLSHGLDLGNYLHSIDTAFKMKFNIFLHFTINFNQPCDNIITVKQSRTK